MNYTKKKPKGTIFLPNGSKIWENPIIPQKLKQKYVDLELDKVTLCIANVPSNAQENEMREYFQTILITLKPALGNGFI